MTTIEQFAMRWLRFDKRCVLILNERHPRNCWALTRPDCIGVTKDRHVIEIEVKRTLQDFKDNANKRGLYKARLMPKTFPRQFYFIVPWALVEKVQPHLPEWAGLMHAPNAQQMQTIYIVKRAPVNKFSERMSLLECRHCVEMMSNQIMAQQDKISELQSRLALTTT